MPAGFVFSVALFVREGEWANGHLFVASRAFCSGGSEIKRGFYYPWVDIRNEGVVKPNSGRW